MTDHPASWRMPTPEQMEKLASDRLRTVRSGDPGPDGPLPRDVDTGDWAAEFANTELVELAGRSIYILHDLNSLQIDPTARGIDVVVSGHSHAPKVQTIDNVLCLNPGSAGRRRFKLPIALATIDVGPGGMRPVIHDLGVS